LKIFQQYIVILLLTICNNSYANQGAFDFQLDAAFQYKNIAPFVKVYGDTSLVQDFDFILENSASLDFQINERRGIHKGISRAIYWVKFPVTNNASERQDFILEIREANIHALQFFIIKNDTIEKSVLTGDYFPMEERPIYHRHFLFPFNLPPQESATCYVMAEKRSQSLNFNLELWERNSFLENDNTRNIAYGIILGLMILYFGNSLLLLVLFPEKLTGYYFMLVVFLLIVINTMEGFAFQFLWSEVPIIVYDYFRSFNSVFQFLFLAYFFYEFLKNKFSQNFFHIALGNLNKVFLVLLVLSSILFLSIEYYYPDFRNQAGSKLLGKTLLLIQFVVHLFSFIVIIILAVLNFLQKKDFENFVLCFVIFMYLAIVSLVTLNIFGSLNSGPHFNKVILVSFILEITLFSILLFSKFWKLTQQKEKLHFVNSQQELQIANTLLKGQENERLRIANDLHNQLQPLIAHSQFAFQKEVFAIQSDPIQKVNELLYKSHQEVNRIANNLIPDSFNKSDLTISIQALCEMVNESKMIQVDCFTKNISSTFTSHQRINIYRIVQELLNNIIKHAQATQVKLVLQEEAKYLKITVDDNGVGVGEKLNVNSLLLENKFGALKFRIQSMNGKIHFLKSELSGLKVEVILPL